MITIVSKNIVKEGKAEEFKNLAKELIEESRKEAGCISYNLNQDINNSNILTFIEEWKDKEAIEKHNKSTHFTSIVPKLGELREDKELNLYVRV
ncbi:antibiotic biosynthesis monooxygenase [Clostridium sp. YIM B02515]|uniref:Antibiotic biosynthesis monooxygenase n=1 Tax=Clostridium rhizosphaerae TaxID=2803861 RepID=A0ABS1T8H2_9CLOT|nr:putative quinol monooxygenase [Clostridium rhizosphaerae]MBL4935620.1 antibiotic biosynthesis monooxygenase [Clostridium rhizosphaerae]